MSDALPPQVKKYFWGDDLGELHWPTHQQYIVQTLFDKGGRGAVRWLFQRINKEDLFSMLPALRLSTRSKNFWQIYLS